MGVFVPEIPGIKNLGGDPRELNNEFELRNVGFNFNLCFFQFCFNKKTSHSNYAPRLFLASLTDIK